MVMVYFSEWTPISYCVIVTTKNSNIRNKCNSWFQFSFPCYLHSILFRYFQVHLVSFIFYLKTTYYRQLSMINYWTKVPILKKSNINWKIFLINLKLDIVLWTLKIKLDSIQQWFRFLDSVLTLFAEQCNYNIEASTILKLDSSLNSVFRNS